MSIEYKKLNDIEIKSEEDSEFFVVSGYASTFGNIDRVGDIVVKGAFLDSIAEGMPKLLNNHDSSDPVGIITEAFEDEKGLFIRGKMPKDNTKVRDIASLMRIKAIDDFSIGFISEESEYDNEGNRKILKAKLFEVSIVTIPANPQAKVTDFKSIMPFKDSLPMAEMNTYWDESKAILKVKEFTNAHSEPNEQYAQAFLYVDEERKNCFEAYKFPIVNVIENKLKVVPRALFATASMLRSLKEDSGFNGETKHALIRNLNQYYDKLGVESPFNKGQKRFVDVKEVEKINNKRDLEQLFLETGYFTKKACVALASRLVEKELSVSDSADNIESDSQKQEDMQAVKDMLLAAINKIKQ